MMSTTLPNTRKSWGRSLSTILKKHLRAPSDSPEGGSLIVVAPPTHHAYRPSADIDVSNSHFNDYLTYPNQTVDYQLLSSFLESATTEVCQSTGLNTIQHGYFLTIFSFSLNRVHSRQIPQHHTIMNKLSRQLELSSTTLNQRCWRPKTPSKIYFLACRRSRKNLASITSS